MNPVTRAQTSHDIDELVRLARHKSKPVRRAVAGNPNAPWELLRDLLGEYAREVIDNPALPLLLLSDPGLFHRLPLAALRGLAKVRKRLGRLLGWTEARPWTELQLTLECMAQAGRRLPFSPRFRPPLWVIRQSLVQHRALPEALELRLLGDSSEAVVRALAESSHTPTVIEALLDTPKRHALLAGNPYLPTCYQWALAHDSDVQVRRALARNTGLAMEVRQVLARDRDAFVRQAIARSIQGPAEQWRELCWDDDGGVQRVARASLSPASDS